MIKVGITGSQGFVGYHLYQTLALHKEEFTLIKFERNFLEDYQALDNFVSNCDVIVHLAAMKRHDDSDVIYESNISLVKKLIMFLEQPYFARIKCEENERTFSFYLSMVSY